MIAYTTKTQSDLVNATCAALSCYRRAVLWVFRDKCVVECYCLKCAREKIEALKMLDELAEAV